MTALLLLSLVGGCACDPGSRARRAVEEARAEGAATYAPTQLSRAEGALEEAARTDGAARDRLHEEARRLARAAIDRTKERAARVAAAKLEAVESEAARMAESASEAAAHLASAEARVGDVVALPEGARTLHVREAAALAFDTRALLLDVRPSSARRELVPGAADAPPAVLEHTRWPQGAELVLLGSGAGTRDVATAAGTLLRRGYTRVSIVEGGVEAWRAASLPLDVGVQASDVPVVSPEQLAVELGGDAVIVDVRDARSFAAGHVPGAVHVAPDDLESAAAKSLAGHRVVVYAASDEPARRAAARLVKAGHRDVRRLLGGVVAWARAGQRFDASPAPTVTKVARRDVLETETLDEVTP